MLRNMLRTLVRAILAFFKWLFRAILIWGYAPTRNRITQKSNDALPRMISKVVGVAPTIQLVLLNRYCV